MDRQRRQPHLQRVRLSAPDDERLELAINRLIALCPVLRTVYDAVTQRFISVSQAGHMAVNDLRLDDEATALARARVCPIRSIRSTVSRCSLLKSAGCAIATCCISVSI